LLRLICCVSEAPRTPAAQRDDAGMGNLCVSAKAVEEPNQKGGEAAGAASTKTPAQNKFPWDWPSGAEQVGYLTERQVKARLKTQSEQIIDLPDGYRLRYAAASQRGYYPQQADKANQDSLAIHIDLNGAGNHWFAVYDGHGPIGEKCSTFACEHCPKQFVDALKDGSGVSAALSSAHVTTNKMLAQRSDIDDTQSGTTAITMYLSGREVTISNVGDSRCMLGSVGDDGGIVAKALSLDQTPYRRDERERVKKYGARVMTADQIDGVEPIHENWDCNLGDEIDDGGDPPRIWAQEQEYPGTAFTRSIGDSLAEALGVVAEPEVDSHKIGPRDRVIMVASDGIFEFITTKQCVDVALLYSDPLEACKALVGEAYKLWIEREDRTDDITIILGFIEPPGVGDHSMRAHAEDLECTDVNVEGADADDGKGGGKPTTRRGSLQQQKEQ